MSEEENFDEIFRQKFAEKEFIFNEENWEKAEHKINSSRRSGKIVKWIVVFMIGLGCGIAVMLPFVGNKNENNEHEMAELTTKVKTGNEIAEVGKEENKNTVSPKEIKTENQHEEKAITNSDEKVITEVSDSKIKSENPHLQKSQSPSLKSDESQSSNSFIRKNKINSPHKSNRKIVEASSENKKSEKEAEPNATKAKKETRKMKLSGNPELSEKKARKNSSPEKKSQPINVSEQMASNTAKDSEKNISDNNSAQKETSPVQSKKAAQALIQQTPEKNNMPAETPAQTTAATDFNQQSAVPATKKDSVQSKLDSSPVVSQNNSAEQPPMSRLASANIISIEAGTNFVLGWHYHDTLEGRGFNPLFGIGFTHYFNQTWSLYSAIQYGSISNLNAQKIFSSQTFDFGSNSVTTIVNTKTLYYAVLPIQFQYHFNDKNSIGIGGSVSYLVNSKSKVITNTISSDTLNMPGTQKTVIGYYSGAFNRWDASLCVAYRRRIFGKFSSSASVNYGLLDIKSNSFFSRNQFERNVGLKISLSYDLFQF